MQWLVCAFSCNSFCFLLVSCVVGGGKQSQTFLGREISLALFVDVLNVGGVLSSLVIDLQCFLSSILDKYCLRFAGGILCYSVVLQFCSVVHLVGFSLVCFMGIALPDALWVARILQQLSLGDGIWLFPILVWFIAGILCVLRPSPPT